MEHRRRLILAIFVVLLFAFCSGRELKVKHKHKHIDHFPIYNHTLATILVEYASAVYMSDLTELFTWTCSRCDDLTEGFEIIELIVDIQHCLQVHFLLVHHGFYNAYHNTTLRPGILNAVKRAKEYYGDLDIMVTGHSMGGAIAAFCGLDLTVNHKAKNVMVMTFGQPRIGNAAFASYYSQCVPNTIRVTNDHDIVPHLPPYYSYFPQKTYHHFPREVWLYNVGLGSLVYTVEKVCDVTGEDPTCSRSVSGTSISDHIIYYGVELMAETWRSCGIVMDSRVKEYGKTDLKGNFVLSRDPASPILKLKTEAYGGGNHV
ncbi:hypothetical protein GH714_002313 [Hevea brasiliensis]|uniref:Fungal lipase-type domain-containing protein n=1 Tax=Hevea brasiliensis TaxID=3981 RepID=A0A6A6KHA6_HEVBR|nr:hypothetical protein GH714_002313 [Hevea brasiliensis]